MYLTFEEYKELMPKSKIDDVQFADLSLRAEDSINLFIDHFYEMVDFETDFNMRKRAVKKAIAYQIDYLEKSGIMTVSEKQDVSIVSVGRTKIHYNHDHSKSFIGARYNLSPDAEIFLKSAGFGRYTGVFYDR